VVFQQAAGKIALLFSIFSYTGKYRGERVMAYICTKGPSTINNEGTPFDTALVVTYGRETTIGDVREMIDCLLAQYQEGHGLVVAAVPLAARGFGMFEVRSKVPEVDLLKGKMNALLLCTHLPFAALTGPIIAWRVGCKIVASAKEVPTLMQSARPQLMDKCGLSADYCDTLESTMSKLRAEYMAVRRIS
jgi:hypothetical protein